MMEEVSRQGVLLGIQAKYVFMAKYDAKAEKKIGKVLHEFEEGKLKMGRSGKKVTDRKQAIAIGISEARKEGDKVPKRK